MDPEIVVVVPSLSPVRLFAAPWTATQQASMSFTTSQSLLELMSIESMMPSNPLILCCPFFLLPSIFPSIRVFCSELALCIRWPKFWGFSSCNEYSGLISFRIDWFGPAVQGTIKSISRTTVERHWFVGAQSFYGPTLTTGKTIALTIWIFVGKVMYLLLKMLSRFVIAFLPSRNYILISWLLSRSAVILEPPK